MRDAGGLIGELRLNDVGVAVSQADVESVLRAELEKRGVTVRWNTTAIDLLDANGNSMQSRASAEATAAQDFVVVQFADKSTLRARFLLAADGVHSFVRHRLNMSFTGHRVDGVKLLACDCDIEPNPDFTGATGNFFMPNQAYVRRKSRTAEHECKRECH